MIAVATAFLGSRGLGTTAPLLIFLGAGLAVIVIGAGVLLLRRLGRQRGAPKSPPGGSTSLSTSLLSARRPRPEQDPERGFDENRTPDDQGDFADEHSSPTFADQQRGGPEGRPEPESPKGYSGMDPMAADEDRHHGRSAGRRRDDR